MVYSAQEWKWSSYGAMTGQSKIPFWLHTEWILSAFNPMKGRAIEACKRFVSEGKEQSSPWSNLKNQVFLGSDEFVERTSQKIKNGIDLSDIPASQRRSIPKPLKYYRENHSDRNAAIISAYKSEGYSMKEVGEYFGLSCSMVSRVLKYSKFKT